MRLCHHRTSLDGAEKFLQRGVVRHRAKGKKDMATSNASHLSDEEIEFKYWAFISYSHRDEAWAQWIHRAVETYLLPKGVAGSDFHGEKVPPRLRPVFRDRDELAGGPILAQNCGGICRNHAA
jgi:hypothetical protein